MNPDTGTQLDQSADLWHLVYSRWRAMFHPPDKETKIIYTSVDGERILRVRPLDTTKSFSTQNFEGIDPEIYRYGSLVQIMAAELLSTSANRTCTSMRSPHRATRGSPFRTSTPSTVDIWSEWELAWGGTVCASRLQLLQRDQGPRHRRSRQDCPHPADRRRRRGGHLGVHSSGSRNVHLGDGNPGRAARRRPGLRISHPTRSGTSDPERGAAWSVSSEYRTPRRCGSRCHAGMTPPFSTPLVA